MKVIATCKEVQEGHNFSLLEDMHQMNTRIHSCRKSPSEMEYKRKHLDNVTGAISKQGKIFLLVSLPECICWYNHTLLANVLNSPSANGLVVESQIVPQ